MHTIVIFGNGELRDLPRHRLYLQSAGESARVICADGGTEHARRLGLAIHTIIGDLDSLEQGLYDDMAREASFKVYPRHKDKSDLEMALDYALLSQPSSIIIMGGLGARIDHGLTNIHLLEKCLKRDIPCTLVSDHEELFLVDRLAIVRGTPGRVVSLIPLSSEVKGLFLTGFAYPLHGESLYRDQSRGQSNELLGKEGTIELEEGLLLVVVNRETEEQVDTAAPGRPAST